MIRINIYQKTDDLYTGFDCMGHAEFADKGKDIVCAGVSALVINTINSVLTFTEDTFETKAEEKSGKLSFYHKGSAISKESELLMKSLVLGLQGIQKNYGTAYITLNFKEV